MLQNGVGTGGRPAPVTAGLQGDIEGRPGRVLGTGGQGVALGVEAPAFLVPPLADDPAVLYDDAAHHGIGADPPHPPLGQRQGPGHPLGILQLGSPRNEKSPESRRLSGHTRQKNSEIPTAFQKQQTDGTGASPLRIFFFHPDFTVGSGVPPDHASLPKTGGGRLAGCTAGRELHPALKNLIIRFSQKHPSV